MLADDNRFVHSQVCIYTWFDMAHGCINIVFLLPQGDESHKADEYIRYIKDRLPEAIVQCIKAAGEEFIPKIQQSLLRVGPVTLAITQRLWR